ncbi:YigZ family protein [Salinimonas marina]|uniref:YigZ family protein n=1 Tax=Salinimonas marina TaxID=2785918 RepID=A0A7S9DW84_9ALTE|nr:YigZ family protein [Salinimonas marina]QPG05084.1 YigZ family protein [Salinimonas marina]
MAYNIPRGWHQTRLEIKKSSFIGIAQHVADREQAMAFLKQVKAQYPDARHHCWAYLFGDPQMPVSVAMADDGEPSGTAGKPILNVLQHNQTGDVMIVVVRYFGGIKLGAGGLVRAYSGSTQMTLESLPTVAHVVLVKRHIVTDFKHEQFLRHFVDEHQGQIDKVSYDHRVHLTLALPETALTPLVSLAGSMGFTVYPLAQQ